MLTGKEEDASKGTGKRPNNTATAKVSIAQPKGKVNNTPLPPPAKPQRRKTVPTPTPPTTPIKVLQKPSVNVPPAAQIQQLLDTIALVSDAFARCVALSPPRFEALRGISSHIATILTRTTNLTTSAARNTTIIPALRPLISSWLTTLLTFRTTYTCAINSPFDPVRLGQELTAQGFSDFLDFCNRSISSNAKTLYLIQHTLQLSSLIVEFNTMRREETRKWSEYQSHLSKSATTLQNAWLNRNQTPPLFTNDVQLHSIVSPHMPNQETLAQQIDSVKAAIMTVLVPIFPSCEVSVFGSSYTGLGFVNSDIDLLLQHVELTPDMGTAHDLCASPEIATEILIHDKSFSESTAEDDATVNITSPQQRLTALVSNCKPESRLVLVLGHLLRSRDCFTQVMTVSGARVPVITLEFDGLHCDVICTNVLGVHNSKLLLSYVKTDPRVRLLIMAVKLWAKARRLAQARTGFLSSYAWVILVIKFLINENIVPNLQLPDANSCTTRQTCVVGQWTVDYCDVIQPVSKCLVHPDVSVTELLRRFFLYMAKSTKSSKSESFKTHVVSIRTNDVFKKGSNVHDLGEAPSWRWSIEDPFELTHDLGNTISSRFCQSVIDDELIRSWHVLEKQRVGGGDTPLAELFTECLVEYDFRGKMSCHRCGDTGHRAKNCFLENLLGGGRHVDGCFKCGKVGHIARECTSTVVEAPVITLADSNGQNVCFICGLPGHKAKQCTGNNNNKGAGSGGMRQGVLYTGKGNNGMAVQQQRRPNHNSGNVTSPPPVMKPRTPVVFSPPNHARGKQGPPMTQPRRPLPHLPRQPIVPIVPSQSPVE